MDSIEVVGGMKIEPHEIKLEKPDNNQEKVVEIAADDIKSDEESEQDYEEDTVGELGIEDVNEEELLTKNISSIKKEKGNSDLSKKETEEKTLILNDAYENSSYESSNEEDDNNKLRSDGEDVNSKEKHPNPVPVNNEEQPQAKKPDVSGENKSKNTITDKERMANKTLTPSRHTAKYEYSLQDGKNYKCNYCKEVIPSKREVRLHIIKKHRKVKLFKCPHCPYETPHDLGLHIRFKHTDDKDIHFFRCDKCDFKGKTKSSLRRHVSIHMSVPQLMGQLNECKLCPKVYRKKDCLTRHVKIVHNGEKVKKLKCSQCDYQCRQKLSLKSHMAMYHVESETLETLKCPECPYKTKYSSRLKGHVKNRHGSGAQCHICPYRASNEAVLKLHLISHKKEKDDGDLRYRCDKCDYKTYREYNLRIHKLNHLKPEEIEYFHCHHCDFKANRKDNLKVHIFKHFKKEELTLKCYICDFTTKKRDQLVRHIDKHSKEFKEGKKQNDTKVATDDDKIEHSKEFKEEKKQYDTKEAIDDDEIKHSKKFKEGKKQNDTKLATDEDEIKHSKKFKEGKKQNDTKLATDDDKIEHSKEFKKEKRKKDATPENDEIKQSKKLKGEKKTNNRRLKKKNNRK